MGKGRKVFNKRENIKAGEPKVPHSFSPEKELECFKLPEGFVAELISLKQKVQESLSIYNGTPQVGCGP